MKEIVLEVHITLLRPQLMHKLREENNASKGLEHSKHTLDSVGLCFTWTVIFNAYKNAKPRKRHHMLNFERLALFRNGVTRGINYRLQTPYKEMSSHSIQFLGN